MNFDIFRLHIYTSCCSGSYTMKIFEYRFNLMFFENVKRYTTALVRVRLAGINYLDTFSLKITANIVVHGHAVTTVYVFRL